MKSDSRYDGLPAALAQLPYLTLAWNVGYAYNGGPYSARVVIWDDEPGAREFNAVHQRSAAAALLDAIAMANAARVPA